MLAFGLGSGIAGLGGVALSQLGNVGPELGQGYIIDSFLVVVARRRRPAGRHRSRRALGLGVLQQSVGAADGRGAGQNRRFWCLIVLFIQKRPQGLFALKGRVID